MRKSASFRALLAAGLLTLAGSCLAAKDIVQASDFLDYLHPGAADAPLTYHDLIMADGYHLYFTFNDDQPASRYQAWPLERLRRELLPELDRYACADTLAARPGDDMRWPEYRRKGGSLVVHVESLQDVDYSVVVVAPGRAGLCR
ncbi:hypothetical protein [Chromobacterium vaccinii]|uniref:Uncharacterized protein n=1 Tax=Chromobacterium vaccinii TaxID=1108595 RepID=A0A1D9LIX4_9NEIS|nr:hypothetical protein [Chromobacterium vaccinii]AOZ51226.1 hypothetical protein BKX93_15260 [Chromobacterium vaccinii]